MYYFKVQFCIDVDQSTEATGIMYGQSYEAAMSRLARFYGENEIVNITLKCIALANEPLIFKDETSLPEEIFEDNW